MSMNAQIIYRNWRHSGLPTDFYPKYSSAYSSSIFAAGELSCLGTQSQGSTVLGIRFGHTKPAETTNLSAPLCLPELKTKEVFMTVLGQLREGRDSSADKIQFCEQTLPGRLRFAPVLSWLTSYGHDIYCNIKNVPDWICYPRESQLKSTTDLFLGTYRFLLSLSLAVQGSVAPPLV